MDKMFEYIINIAILWFEFVYSAITSPISTLSIADIFGLLTTGCAPYIVISIIKGFQRDGIDENDF